MPKKLAVWFGKIDYSGDESPRVYALFSGTEGDLATAIKASRFIQVQKKDGTDYWLNLDHVRSVTPDGYVETD